MTIKKNTTGDYKAECFFDRSGAFPYRWYWGPYSMVRSFAKNKKVSWGCCLVFFAAATLHKAFLQSRSQADASQAHILSLWFSKVKKSAECYELDASYRSCSARFWDAFGFGCFMEQSLWQQGLEEQYFIVLRKYK